MKIKEEKGKREKKRLSRLNQTTIGQMCRLIKEGMPKQFKCCNENLCLINERPHIHLPKSIMTAHICQ